MASMIILCKHGIEDCAEYDKSGIIMGVKQG